MKTIFFLENQYPYWGWHEVLLEALIYIKDKYDAKLVHQKGGYLKIDKFDYDLIDCELLIHDEEEDSLKCIFWGESRTGVFDIFEKRNNPKDILLVTQFYNIYPKTFDRSVWNFKIKNTTYYTFNPNVNHEYYYHQRKLYEYLNETTIDKLFCLFSTGRPIGEQLRAEGLITEREGPMTIHDYLMMAVKYRMGLALSGVAEVNFREIEYLSIGVPMLRIEYMTQLDPPLIPNYHYVAVDRSNFPWNMYADREGGPEYVEAYRQRYNEVKDDKDFLQFVAKNGRDYYTEYCNPFNRLKHVIEKLEL
jgi:hypothetical protein